MALPRSSEATFGLRGVDVRPEHPSGGASVEKSVGHRPAH